MEEISVELKVSKSKQASLCLAYETLRSEANSILELAHRWKDLEDHFNATRSSLALRLAELSEREKSVAARETESASKNSDFELKSKRLDEIEMAIETKSKILGEVERLIEARNRDAESLNSAIGEKRRELGVVDQWMAKKSRECHRLKEVIKERTKRIDFLERSSRQKHTEVESSRKELGLVRGMLSKTREDLDFVRVSLGKQEDQLRACRNSVQESDGEIRLRGEVLCSIQESIANCSSELESKQKRLDSLRRDFELKQRAFVSLKKSLDELARKFDAKENQVNGLVQKVHQVNQESFGTELEEVRLIHTMVNECLEVVEKKEKSLVSFQRSLDERSIELEKREKALEDRLEQLARGQKKLDLIQNSTDSEGKETTSTVCSTVKIEQSENDHNVTIVPYSASHQYDATNGQLLQSLFTEQLKRHSERCKEFFDVLEGSLDPPKLVLEAVSSGFFPLDSGEGKDTTSFHLSAVRSSCILLLEKLMAMSPEISPQVQAKANELATEWKARMGMGIESHLEVSGFLQFLISYRLCSDFAGDEIRRFVELDQQLRQESSFERALCLADEVSHEPPVNTYQAENVMEVTSPPNLIGNDLTQDDILIALQQPGNDLTQDDILIALQQPDPADHVLGMVKDSFSQLWKRGDHVGSSGVCFLKSYIFIFEQLLRNSREIQTNVREDAMKLAKEWEGRMRKNNVENCLEALGFLIFLAAYDLVSSINENYLTSFMEIVSRDRLVLEQSQNILGLGYKIDEFIQNLIGKKKHLAAARLSCAFKLTDKFSPAKLLADHVGEAKICSRQLSQEKKSVEDKDKATDLEIAALTDVTRFVKDRDLEPEFPLDNVTRRIALLEKIKTDRLHAAEFFRGTEEEHEQQQQICSKRKTSASSDEQQQQQRIKKFPRKLSFG